MNITFLIGNGFDRALGLETGYSSFYEWYVEQSQKGLPDHVINFRNEIDKFVRKTKDAEPYWADAEEGFGKYTEQFTDKPIEQFMDCYEDFRNNLIQYLLDEDQKIDNALAAKMRDSFLPQMLSFHQEADSVDRQTLTQIRNAVKDSANSLTLITFNYTRSIDKIFDGSLPMRVGTWVGNDRNTHSLSIGRIIHAHGYLDNYPIFGVCNPKNIIHSVFLNNDVFSSMMIKLQSIQAAGELWRVDTKNTIDKSTIICIFGMSLGITDSDYWEMIVEWLKKDSNHHLVIFWRNSELKHIHTSIREKMEEKRVVYKKLFDGSDVDDALAEKLKRQIYIVFNSTKMFNLPDNVKVKSTKVRNRETLDSAIQETIQELTSSTNNDSHVIDRYNASLPQITVV